MDNTTTHNKSYLQDMVWDKMSNTQSKDEPDCLTLALTASDSINDLIRAVTYGQQLEVKEALVVSIVSLFTIASINGVDIEADLVAALSTEPLRNIRRA